MATGYTAPITALLLCGGRGTRMGGVDKPLQSFQGQPLVHHVLARIAPQVAGRVVISANRSLAAYAALGYPVVPDSLSDFQGPLAGILAGLAHVTAGEAAGSTGWLLCVSGDSPWLPADLAARLWAAASGSDDAGASAPSAPSPRLMPPPAQVPRPPDSAMALGREAPDGSLRSQPLASLIHTRHLQSLADALAAGERRVEAWLRSLPLAEVPFDRPQDAYAFANVNDRSQLERHAPAP